MYGFQCDMCGRFAKIDDMEDWGRIQTLTSAYVGEFPEVKGESKHLCPTCLAIIKDQFLNGGN